MAIPSRFTKVKIAAGYTLLLVVLLLSLLFVHREMEKLSDTDDVQSLQTDSLLLLLKEKDENTIRMLQIINEANESMITPVELDSIIAEQDTVITQQRVQHRIITKRDSVITKRKKKGFFRRLGEVFAPSKEDTAVLVNTAVEFATDTILEPYNPIDSLHQRIRTVTKRKSRPVVRPNYNARLRRMNKELTTRIDSMITTYEQVVTQRAMDNASEQQELRNRSTRTIGGIAIAAVLLSACFLIMIWRDITRSNRYRKELEEANKRAEALLEAREKLMLAITHDFKAPLGSIIGYTDLLTGLTTDKRQRFYLDNMKSSSQHLLKLVSDLLDFHRLDLNKAEVNRVTFNPAQLFEEIRISFKPLTDAKHLTLSCSIDAELDGRFISDPLRIRQIVNNLLSNAVKFTAKGSIALNITYHSSSVRIEVVDTGKGMAPGDREKIFQEFTRLPGAQDEEGFGLGLSIVHKLVTLLEGSISVQSTLGEGSRFIVILPLYPVGPVTGEKREGNVSSVSTTDQAGEDGVMASPKLNRVLLIDDDRIQLALTAAMLEQQGIQAVCCQQPDELIEQLRTATFDVLLTDVQMPAINGFDLLKLLRASNIPQARTIPVIAVTARSEMNEQDFQEHGFAGCLHKPFTVKELLTIISGEEMTGSSAELTPDSLNFRALTAFSEDDPEAASTIIQTFIEETEKNRNRMESAIRATDVDGIAGMAHKLLPLFTLLGASEALPLLLWLEQRRGEAVSDEMIQKANEALRQVDIVMAEARRYAAGD